jgi:hypothetical protein
MVREIVPINERCRHIVELLIKILEWKLLTLAIQVKHNDLVGVALSTPHKEISAILGQHVNHLVVTLGAATDWMSQSMSIRSMSIRSIDSSSKSMMFEEAFVV